MARKQQSQDERAARRLLKRAIRLKDWTMVVMVLRELGNILIEEGSEEETVAPTKSGDIAYKDMLDRRGEKPVSRPNLSVVAQSTG